MKIIYLSLIFSGVAMMQAKDAPKNPESAQQQVVAPELLAQPLKVRYTNWRGETAIRTIVPLRVYFGKTEYHPEEQWLLAVWDVERGAERVYAFKEIKEILG